MATNPEDMIVLRNGGWSLYKRVPKRFALVEDRQHVMKSLKTDSRSVALQKVMTVWRAMEAGWEAKLAGQDTDAQKRFAAAHDLAQSLGFNYMPIDRVAALPLPDLAKRLRAAVVNGKTDAIVGAAVLGTVAAPKLTVMGALDRYWIEFRDKTAGMSPDQVRRWKNPRLKAFRNFVAVVGDKALDELSREDMLAFRQWWDDRIKERSMAANSGNKDIINLSTVLKDVVKRLRLPIVLPPGDLLFEKDKRPKRQPFSEDWIKTRILALGALDGLDVEARCIVLSMINTGMSQGEAAGLLPEHIRLDASVPHVTIVPEGRLLKTDNRERKIPLTGVSLDAFRECPNGFPTYRFKDKINDRLGQYFETNKLKETPQHVLYSLRHSFEDRMLHAGFDYTVRCELFGHKYDRPKYGNGPSLEYKAKLLESIAL